MDISRRDLLKNGALVGGAVAASAFGLAGCAAGNAAPAAAASSTDAEEAEPSTTEAAAPAETTGNEAADLVIVGEGMGGLTAGIRALENGIANVTIVEASKWPGGGSSFSLGGIHANGMGNSAELYRENTRYQSISELATESFLGIQDLLDWLQKYNMPVSIQAPGEGVGGAQSGGAANDLSSGNMLTEDGESGLEACINFFRAYEEQFLSMGGTVMHEVSARRIKQDDAGNIAGVICVNKDGSTFVIDTTQVILATGGWQNNEEMKSRYLGHDAWQCGNMGTPYNMGSGMVMAQECGAALQGDFGHFAGLFLPALPAKNWMEDVEAYEEKDYDWEEGGKWWQWLEIIDAMPQQGILVNAEGKRFCDEGRFRHSYEPAMAKQTHATGHIICDAATWDGWMRASGWGLPEGYINQDRIDHICSEEIGGAFFTGATLEELADNMNASGVATYAMHKDNLVATVAEYNAAAEAENGAGLTPERVTYPCVPLAEGPFYALPIRNAIFNTFGGVAINTKAQVLDVAQRPISGLYATSPCAGGMMQEFYAGGIAHAGSTGFWAADAAAEALGV